MTPRSYADWCMHVMSQDMHFVFFCVTPRIQRGALALSGNSWKRGGLDVVVGRAEPSEPRRAYSLALCSREQSRGRNQATLFMCDGDALAHKPRLLITRIFMQFHRLTLDTDTCHCLRASRLLVLPHCFSSLCCAKCVCCRHQRALGNPVHFSTKYNACLHAPAVFLYSALEG